MGEGSKIGWTDHTFNPFIGCTEVSPGCDACYARTLAERYGWAKWGDHPRHRTSAENWKKPLTWNRKAEAFQADHGRRQRVFCASLADVFDNQVNPHWRADLWALIAQCHDLDWLLLTKRPQNIKKMLPSAYVEQLVGRDLPPWPWPNVWLGTTAENQDEADKRIPHLLDVPARVRFVSAEPLLGEINFWRDGPVAFLRGPARLDWIIVGCESGAHARPMSLNWARFLHDQCRSAGAAFFMKQLPATRGKVITDINQFPEDLRIQEFPATA